MIICYIYYELLFTLVHGFKAISQINFTGSINSDSVFFSKLRERKIVGRSKCFLFSQMEQKFELNRCAHFWILRAHTEALWFNCFVSYFCFPFLKKKSIFGTAALKNGIYCFEPIERVSIQGIAHQSFVTVKYLTARQIPPRLQQVQFAMTCLCAFKNE